MSMDPTIKRQWTDALRSDDYIQGEGALYSKADNRYCCLGVLCDLAEKAGVVLRSEVLFEITPVSEAVVTKWGTVDPKDDVLPKEVMDWCGLHASNPEVLLTDRHCDAVDCEEPDCDGDHEEWKDLADLNDSGTTFEELAALIEEQL